MTWIDTRRPGLDLHYWRSTSQFEVDFILGGHTAIEVKATWEAAFHSAAHAVPGTTWTRDRVLENLTTTARAFDHLGEHARGAACGTRSRPFSRLPLEQPLPHDPEAV